MTCLLSLTAELMHLPATSPSDHHVQYVPALRPFASRLNPLPPPVISASSALCVFLAMLFALSTLVDAQHRIRLDRLDSRAPAFYRWRDDQARRAWTGVKRRAGGAGALLGLWQEAAETGGAEERHRLLEGQEGREGSR